MSQDEGEHAAVDPGELEAVIKLLERIAGDRRLLVGTSKETLQRLMTASGLISKPDLLSTRALRKAKRKQVKLDRKRHDETILARTRIRQQRHLLVYPTPDPPLIRQDPLEDATVPMEAGEGLRTPRNCYICKADYREVHFFYDALCPTCAVFNWRKRNQTADLQGRVAVLTGGRVKIGYQTGIILLRAGARLIVTTRFPRDAAARYARERDADAWRDRLEIHGLDLRHTPSVEAFCRHLNRSLPQLDFIVNNACQTVRRPPGYYGHLMAAEEQPLNTLSAPAQGLLEAWESARGGWAGEGAESGYTLPIRSGGPGPAGLEHSAALTQLELVAGDEERGTHLFPAGRLDADLQQVDLREVNSWRLPLDQVPTVELLEVHLVNAVAPFVLNGRLKPLMMRTPARDKHIVNVSAVEGQFYRAFKTDKHPHTNMAKAALNMLTRTSAADYLKDGIHMNSVDTGWITDEDPAHITALKREQHGFHPPLDHVDAAARICDPILDGINTGTHVWGQFLKDYTASRW